MFGPVSLPEGYSVINHIKTYYILYSLHYVARYLTVLNIFLIALHVIPETGGKAEIRGLLESVIYVFVYFRTREITIFTQ
jgi:hypothetical protein